MSVKLTTHLAQRLVLTPQLRQRIEMLQMTSVELSELIQQQMLENPILEEVDQREETQDIAQEIIDHDASGTNTPDAVSNLELNPTNAIETVARESSETADYAGEEYSSASETSNQESGDSYDESTSFNDDGEERPLEQRDAFEEIDFGREFQEYLDPGYKTQEFEYKEDAPSFEQFLTRPPSLSEHLSWQLHMEQVAPELVPIAENIIGNLDADGRLHSTVTDEDIAAQEGCTPEAVEQARQVVMQLDPVGCGARTLSECLLVQLTVKGYGSSLAAELLENHPLSDLQPHKLAALSKVINVPVEQLMEQLDLIRTLDPCPGRRFSSGETILIAPEIYIEKRGGEYEISFVDDGSPRLRMNQGYKQMLVRSDTSKETRDFIKDKWRAALDLLRNIDHRQQTIYRVVECIVNRQREFLDHGVQYIKPMMLKDIAEETGMHLSTVSRVVNRKYAHTPQGVIELRRFFTEGMTNEDGEEVSTRIIKLKIKKLIDEEDSQNPITDDQVVKMLAKDGIKLSRRTVAKYRDQMQIPGSRERRAPM